MMSSTHDANAWRSTSILGILLVTALAAQAGRILTARSATGETPFHSANDRSRWCSVAAIGGYGQFEIDPFLEIRDPKTKRRTWSTIDLVRHRGRDGKQHYYSSKPPLLSVMHAGVYAAVHAVTGLSLVTQTFTTARVILVLVNLVPLAGFWWLWGRYFQRRMQSEWGWTLMVTFMLWGTFVSTFANTLNNHLPGAIAAGMALWALLKIIEQEHRELRWFVLAAVSAAFSAVCELPALAWAAAVAVLLLQASPRRGAAGIAIGMLPVAIVFLIVNVLAHGDLRPPYAHRAAGALVTLIPRNVKAADSVQSDSLRSNSAATNSAAISSATTSPAATDDDVASIVAAVRERGFDVSGQAVVRSTRTVGVHELWDERSQLRFAVLLGDKQIAIHQWDDWYDYPNSYWYPDRKQGVDRGEPSRANYLFQSTLGHHGIFSLTPIWLLVPWGGLILWNQSRGTNNGFRLTLRSQLILAIAATTLVCFAFYMLRPMQDRNYGGVSSGFRWMFWFTPLWCWYIAASVDRISSTWSRSLVLAALGVSIFSSVYPWTNPWTAPWLMQWLGG